MCHFRECNTGIFYVFLCCGHSYHPERIAPKLDTCLMGGGGGRGLDLTSSFEANFGARSSQVHQIGGKTWEVLSPQDTEIGKKSPHSGVISQIQRIKFGVIVIYIFWRQNLGLQQEFQRQILGPGPPIS